MSRRPNFELPIRRRDETGKVVWLHQPDAEQAADIAAQAEMAKREAVKRGLAIGEGQAVAKRSSGLIAFDPTTLQGQTIPDQRWIVPDWLPVGIVTINYADGGVGKSLITQQLATSCATGKRWLGIPVKRCRVMALFCEDDNDELSRRQRDINRMMGLQFTDLSGFKWFSSVGEDNTLYNAEAKADKITKRFRDLTHNAKQFGAQLVIVDTAATTFGGNEVIRQQVTEYVGVVLTGLAQDIGGAVLMNTHPSVSGMWANGSKSSGSTGWSNSARSRWYMSRVLDEEKQEADPDLRSLELMKANRARKGTILSMRWVEGAFRLPGQADAEEPATEGNLADIGPAISRQVQAEAAFLAAMDSRWGLSLHTSGNKGASNYGPNVFVSMPESAGFTKVELTAAMKSLLQDGRITRTKYRENYRDLEELSIPTWADRFPRARLTEGDTSYNRRSYPTPKIEE